VCIDDATQTYVSNIQATTVNDDVDDDAADLSLLPAPGLGIVCHHCDCGVHSVIIPSIPEISSVHKVVSIMMITSAS